MTCPGRLTGRTRFQAVRTGGTGARGRVVSMRAVANHEAVLRIGLAVRGSSGAVQRNRARRRLREAARAGAGDFRGQDVVISGAAPVLATVPFAELREDVGGTLRTLLRRPA